MESNFDFKELSNDPSMICKLTEFSKSVSKIEEVLQHVKDIEIYEKLTNSEQVKYNLLLAHSLNSLFWMYLRAEGIDTDEHSIKLEITRFQESLNRCKQIDDRNTIMPRIDKDAAARFIKHGLWVPVDKSKLIDSNEEELVEKSEENWDIKE